MNDTLILTHFSEPNWPVVNKLSGIAKCLNVELIHCPSKEALIEEFSSSSKRRRLFFTDEAQYDLVNHLDSKKPGASFEVAVFLRSPLVTATEKFSEKKIVKY